jgi:replicative DNA helicase
VETRLLGGMIRHPATIPTVLRLVRTEDFRSESDRVVFSALADLSRSNSVIDLVILAEALRDGPGVLQAGGYSRLGELWDSACPEDQVLPLAQRLRELGRE